MADVAENGRSNGVLSLTFEDMLRAVRDSDERARRNMEDNAVNAVAFMRSVPAHLRDHPLVRRMSWYVQTGTPLHPKDRAEIARQYDELVRSGGTGRIEKGSE